jgi:iron complex transport system substrate-binding protein
MMKVSGFTRRHLIVGLCLAGAISFGPRVSAQTIEVPQAQGTARIPVNPARVLTFDLGALDILDALNVPVAGVPKTALPPTLAKYEGAAFEKIGTLFEPDYEIVNAAAPDLIIVGDRSRAKYTDLSKIAPALDLSVDQKDYLASVVSNTRLLGRIFNKQAQAETLVGRIERSVAKLKPVGASAGTGLIVLTTGGKMSAYGPGSRFGMIHDAFGIKPALENLAVATHGQAISAELVLKANPDWLFVLDRDGAVGQGSGAAKRVLENELIARTTAWKKGQVVYLDPMNWYLVGGGVQSLQANIDQIAQAIAKP